MLSRWEKMLSPTENPAPGDKKSRFLKKPADELIGAFSLLPLWKNGKTEKNLIALHHCTKVMTVVPLFRTHPGRHTPSVPPSAPFPLAQESNGFGSLSCVTDERCASIEKMKLSSVWVYLSIVRGRCQGTFAILGDKIVKKEEFVGSAGAGGQIRVLTPEAQNRTIKADIMKNGE